MPPSLKTQIKRFTDAQIEFAVKEVVKLVPEQIRIRTQLGKDLKGGKIKRLAASTVAYRRRYSDNLDSNTSPGRSNLTATGQLLRAIEAKADKNKIVISLKNKRSRDLSGASSKVSNSEVKDFQEDKGRFFFGLAEFEKNFILREILKVLKRK
jgi:hypothetical protein